MAPQLPGCCWCTQYFRWGYPRSNFELLYIQVTLHYTQVTMSYTQVTMHCTQVKINYTHTSCSKLDIQNTSETLKWNTYETHTYVDISAKSNHLCLSKNGGNIMQEMNWSHASCESEVRSHDWQTVGLCLVCR